MTYVCFLLNHTASETLNWRTPLEALRGQTPDISSLLQFEFWEPVYYLTDCKLDYSQKTPFPSGFEEAKGRFVGISENVGSALTFKILTDDTQTIIHRSSVRTALDPTSANKRVDHAKDGEEDTTTPSSHDFIEFVKSPDRPPRTLGSVEDFFSKSIRLEHFPKDPDEFLNWTYLTQPDEKGQSFRAKVKNRIIYNEDDYPEGEVETDPGKRVKFLVGFERSALPIVLWTTTTCWNFSRRNNKLKTPRTLPGGTSAFPHIKAR